MSSDSLGDRMKLYERMPEAAAMPYLPLLARVDGRAFHTFTRGLKRPYDIRLTDLMVATTKHLVEKFDALAGYVQSDEISLLWYQQTFQSQLPFGGRFLKLSSVLASSAAAFFNKFLDNYLKEKDDELASFDGRVWSVPNKDEAANYFLWRERDAVKNSVQMAAQSVYSHRELQGKHGSEQQEMLFQKGINWNDYPPAFKRGTFVRRVQVEKVRSTFPCCDDWDTAAFDGVPSYTRRRVVAHVMPSFSSLTNRIEFLFDTAEPKVATMEAA